MMCEAGGTSPAVVDSVNNMLPSDDTISLSSLEISPPPSRSGDAAGEDDEGRMEDGGNIAGGKQDEKSTASSSLLDLDRDVDPAGELPFEEAGEFIDIKFDRRMFDIRLDR